MGNAVIDITSTTRYLPQFDADQPDPVEAKKAGVEEYIDAWARGELYDDGTVYTAPQERLMEDDWLAQLLKAEGDEQLLQAAKIIKAQLRKFVAAQA